ncbi:hypothetical protein LLG95_13510 [bacterium]|nr:hypothetical protein [bacterium]
MSNHGPSAGEAVVEAIQVRLGRMSGVRRRGRKLKPAEEDQNELELF